MEEISWPDHVGNEEVLRVKDERDILPTITRRQANWSGHILRRNCFLIHVIEGEKEGRIEVTVKWARSSYRMALRKREDTLNWKKKQQIVLCGELALGKAKDRLRNELPWRESKLLRNVGNTSPIIRVSYFRRLLYQQPCEKVTTHILKQVRVCELAISSLSSKDSYRRERDGREDSGGNKFKTKPSFAT